MLEIRVDNTKNVQSAYSVHEKSQGLPWTMKIWKTEDNLMHYRLGCNECNASTIWSCSVEISLYLCGHFAHHFHAEFNQASNHVAGVFENIDELDEVFEVRVEIADCRVMGVRKRKMFDYSTRDPTFTNGILEIEGKRVHINKHHLGIYSEFFKSLFFSNFNEKRQSVVVLHDVSHAAFIDFLDVIHPTRTPITELTVEPILELADRFLADEVVVKCEEFLLKTKKVTMTRKLILAERYRLDALLNSCLSSFKCLDDMSFLSKSESYHEVNESLKSILLERLVRLNTMDD